MGLSLLTIHLNRTNSMKQTIHLEVSPLKPQLELHPQVAIFCDTELTVSPSPRDMSSLPFEARIAE